MKKSDFVASVLKGEFVRSDMSDQMIPIGDLTAQDVLDIYYSDYSARMKEALGEFYETVWFLLGDEDFFSLCEEYIDENPSQLRDLNQYGDEFPAFLKAHELSIDLPYLFEVAEFEKNFWKLFHADVETLEQVFPQNLESARCRFSNGLVLLSFDYNILALWDLRKGNISEEQWEHDVDINISQHILLRREKDQVFIHSISKAEYSLLAELQKGVEVGEALSSIDITSEGVSNVFAFIAGPLKEYISFEGKS